MVSAGAPMATTNVFRFIVELVNVRLTSQPRYLAVACTGSQWAGSCCACSSVELVNVSPVLGLVVTSTLLSMTTASSNMAIGWSLVTTKWQACFVVLHARVVIIVGAILVALVPHNCCERCGQLHSLIEAGCINARISFSQQCISHLSVFLAPT